VEGTNGYQTLLRQLVSSGDVGVLYQGTLSTLLAAAAGHYPWFFVYNALDATLGQGVEGSMETGGLFAAVRQQWNATLATGVSSVADMATAVPRLAVSLMQDISDAFAGLGQWLATLELWDNKVRGDVCIMRCVALQTKYASVF